MPLARLLRWKGSVDRRHCFNCKVFMCATNASKMVTVALLCSTDMFANYRHGQGRHVDSNSDTATRWETAIGSFG